MKSGSVEALLSCLPFIESSRRLKITTNENYESALYETVQLLSN